VNIDEIRKEYQRFHLREQDVDPDPIRQFAAWYADATSCQVVEVNAMALATATPDGRPSVRLVLLRGFDERGFTFFTNYESRKARELEENPRASLALFWHEVERQVRIDGRVVRTSDEESDRYFHGRPAGARIGAWASPQSRVILGREALDSLYREVESRYPDGAIPRPSNWGGYRVIPEAIEFWQGRPSRLHDRLLYTRAADSGWIIERLAP
jgi:pyridoxamine 5'-phosphate oxidase